MRMDKMCVKPWLCFLVIILPGAIALLESISSMLYEQRKPSANLSNIPFVRQRQPTMLSSSAESVDIDAMAVAGTALAIPKFGPVQRKCDNLFFP